MRAKEIISRRVSHVRRSGGAVRRPCSRGDFRRTLEARVTTLREINARDDVNEVRAQRLRIRDPAGACWCTRRWPKSVCRKRSSTSCWRSRVGRGRASGAYVYKVRFRAVAVLRRAGKDAIDPNAEAALNTPISGLGS
jgi:hypothetical protein